MERIKKIIFVVVLFFVTFSFHANAEKVEKVEIQGNERISLETIIIFGDVKLGDNYETADINTLIKKLYETNFFSNIKVILKNGKLTITVEENPIIKARLRKDGYFHSVVGKHYIEKSPRKFYDYNF